MDKSNNIKNSKIQIATFILVVMMFLTMVFVGYKVYVLERQVNTYKEQLETKLNSYKNLIESKATSFENEVKEKENEITKNLSPSNLIDKFIKKEK